MYNHRYLIVPNYYCMQENAKYVRLPTNQVGSSARRKLPRIRSIFIHHFFSLFEGPASRMLLNRGAVTFLVASAFP